MNQIYHADCFDILKTLPDNSVDAIITDPPYGYLKHKLDCPFDYKLWLDECYRILSKNGLLLFFGRGTVAARWQCYAEDLGFKFKEELIWYKKMHSNPLCDLPRVHECAWLFCKGHKRLNKTFIDKIDYDQLTNPIATIYDYKRILSGIKNINSYDDFVKFQQRNKIRKQKHSITIDSNSLIYDKDCYTFTAYQRGRALNSLLAVKKENYNYQHPTQKPVELFKQLVKLISQENDLILDPFGGSGTTAIACLETNRNYIVIEKDAEYFNVIQNRITDWHAKPKQQELNLD